MQGPGHFPADPPVRCLEMLEVAEEAFRAGNFELAAEIYSSQQEELPRTNRALWLRKGDALALAGRVADALDSYFRAAMMNQLSPDELGVLVGSIARNIREKDLGLPSTHSHTHPAAPHSQSSPTMLSCPKCNLLLLDPVTLLCGHTVCKKCMCATGAPDCNRCQDRMKGKAESDLIHSRDFKVNVVLGNLLEKWLGKETRVRRLLVEGQLLRERHNVMGAMEKLSTALQMAPCDSLLTAERADMYLLMKNFKQALADADFVCRNQPLWPQGHCIKAKALSELGRTDEALKEFLYCVALNPEWSSMKTEAQKILCDMLLPTFDNVQASLGSPFHVQPSYNELKLCFLNSSCASAANMPLPGCSKDLLFKLTKCSFPVNGSFQTKEFTEEASRSCGHSIDKTAAIPCANLKRKHPNSLEDNQSAAKVIKTDNERKCENSIESEIQDIPLHLVDACDFECSLCMRLFYEPVTTQCGHTFCLKCLERCLDHNAHCPLCKENLSQYLAYRAYKKTFLTEELIIKYLPEELVERKKLHDEEIKELSNLNKDVPIFVCTMAFPTIPCPLHVFEPRYRLMIRRSMEIGTKQFGMCIADDLKGFADYGCMLQVRDVKFFPDGRSVVDTVGLRRFRVLSHGQRDGYNTANIEYLEDQKVEGQGHEELRLLHDAVYDQALTWFNSLKDNMKAQILSHFGSMPSKESELQNNTNGPAWCWWMLAVLPLENKAQLTILAMTSLKDRLLALKRILIFVTRRRPR
ncbi:hypothetical protein GDO86_003899 [Hymenochirus boettgeri]|uniref:LON peptidase N-terminal domain and ring finger 2 n=1 Tax=Hymenochirus boettgeri TaxID=247094 RepID=A0A8T2K637_9PIPI|nr:hypothetical protein GDO86_003899 [Hymenochirus boettgeri]